MNDVDEKKRQEEEESIEPVFREMYVVLEYSRGEFVLPQGIVNYYNLDDGDALHCELMELRVREGDQTKICAIGKDVLIDVVKEIFQPYHGLFPIGTFSLYEMGKYDYALLKIKKVVRK